MKKTLISFLVMFLMVANAHSVQAAGVQTTSNDNAIKVSLDNIKEIMLENNLDMKSAYNTLRIANQKYKAQKEVVEDYESDVEDYEYAVTAAESAVDENNETSTDETDLTTAETALDTANDNLDKAETTLDEYRTALKQAQINYDKNVESYIYSAQQSYITYLTSVSDRELEESAVKVQERDTQIAKLQYENGFSSKIEYNKTLQENATKSNSLKKLKDAEELAKSNLCTTLGISSGENVAFVTDIKNDLDKVSQINYDDDLGKMLDNNFSIQLAKIDIDDWEDVEDDYEDDDYQEEIYDYTMNNYEIALKQSINTAKLDFNEQYNTLMTSYNTMKSSYDSLDLEKTDYNVAQMQYDYGFISKNEVEDAKIGTDGLDSVNSEYENAKIEFYKNYLHYLQMKEGY